MLVQIYYKYLMFPPLRVLTNFVTLSDISPAVYVFTCRFLEDKVLIYQA